MIYLVFILRRYKFEQICNTAVKGSTDSGQDSRIQARSFVVAIVVDLGSLHFGPVGQFVFADSTFF